MIAGQLRGPAKLPGSLASGDPSEAKTFDGSSITLEPPPAGSPKRHYQHFLIENILPLLSDTRWGKMRKFEFIADILQYCFDSRLDPDSIRRQFSWNNPNE